MLAATDTELKEMNHRNLNIFASFNELTNLKEQNKCSNKGPSGNNFCRKKKASAEVPLSCYPTRVLFGHALCYYNSVPFSLFSIFTGLENLQDEFC